MTQNNLRKWIESFAIITIFLFSVMISGCVQVNESTQTEGSSLGGVIVTQHTYLWGNDGLFTKTYDITLVILGVPKEIESGMSQEQLQAIEQMYGAAGTQQNAFIQPAGIQGNSPIIPVTTIPTPTPSIQHQITDGYWCRDTTMNNNGVNTNVKDCFQFFPDGTLARGFYPVESMTKYCTNINNVISNCLKWSINSQGQYIVPGNYVFTLNDNTLTSAGDYPPFTWSSQGIP
jgi:hypothetical protein